MKTPSAFKTVLQALEIVLTLAVLAGMGFFGWRSALGEGNVLAPASPAEPEPLLFRTNGEAWAPSSVSAEGKVVPARDIQLGFKVPGMVEAVYVAKGESVQAGQELARLGDNTHRQTLVSQAGIDVAAAQNELDALYRNANLAKLEAETAVVDAQIAVDQAQTTLNKLDYQLSDAEIASLEIAVELVRIARNKAYRELQKDTTRVAAQAALAASEARLHYAESYLNAILRVPTELEIAKVQAALALAQAQLEEAQKKAAALQNGPDPEQVALAQAVLASAQARLAAAQAAVKDLVLVSPFSGVVVSASLQPGETVSAGKAIMVIADVSSWRIETTSLTENEVALLAPGMAATVTLAAFPDRRFAGVISEISLLGQKTQDAVTYQVYLNLDDQGVSLRWEMSAFVDIGLP